MGQADDLRLGDWNARCSMCNKKRKASELVKNWQGMWRCPEHNEPRHPQDFVRGIPDIQTPPWTQSLQATSANGVAFISIVKSVKEVDLCSVYFAMHRTAANVKTVVVTVREDVLVDAIVVKKCFTANIVVRNEGVLGGVVNLEGMQVEVTGRATLEPDGLAFRTQPSQAAPRSPFAPVVEVELRAGGIFVPKDGIPVRIVLGENPTGAALGGIFATQETRGGVARFPGLRVNKEGEGYTLVASSGDWRATSQPYRVQ